MPLAYRLLILLMIVVGVGGYAYWVLNGGGLVRDGNWIGVDFHVYYQAGLALRQGEDIYGGAISPPYVYPPLLALLVAPLTFLPVTAATIFWKVLQHVCLVAVGGLLVSMLPVGKRALAVGALCLGLLTVAVQDEIRVGESNNLVLLLVVGALWLVARGEGSDADANLYIGAGLLLGLAVSIKVLPVLVAAFFIWRGPRRVGVAAALSFVALQLVSLALTPATLYYWLVEFPGLFGQAFPFPDNQSINALVSRAVMPGDPSLPPMQIVEADGARPVITWGLNLPVLAGAGYVLWRSRRAGEEMRAVGLLLQVGLVMLTTFLVSGSTWLHHLVGLSVPVVGLVGAWEGGYKPGVVRILAAAAVALGFGLLLRRPYDWLFAVSEVVPGSSLLALAASSAAMWVVVGLWLAVAWTLGGSRFQVQGSRFKVE